MIENLPVYLVWMFGLTTVLTLFLFIWTIRSSKSNETRQKAIPIGIGMALWLIVQALLTLLDIYHADMLSFPPKIILIGLFPALFIIVLLFTTAKGKEFIDSLPLKNLTYLNLVRIPVEIILYSLFLYKAIPELMTFEGRNLDIIAGVTAPIIAYYGLTKEKIGKRLILIWNFVCLGLLFNIVFLAILSSPSPIQKFAFDQPNIAIMKFPFSWLPTFIVPIVLLGHLTSIRLLLKKSTISSN